MPIGPDGLLLASIAGGLVDRSDPRLIGEDQASAVENIHFNRGSAEVAGGYRKLNYSRAKAGAPRLSPTTLRTSSETMTRWRDGYLFAPYHEAFDRSLSTIEAHFRLEGEAFMPETATGAAGTQRVHLPPTGRTSSTIGAQRAGGEHQFVPLVTRGAREVEAPLWGLGVGILRPVGIKDGAGASTASVDRLVPLFWWWEEATATLKWCAADTTIFHGRDYHLALRLADGGTGGQWYLDGQPVNALGTYDVFAIPDRSVLSTDKVPVYIGRNYTREPSISWSRVPRKHAYFGKWNVSVAGSAATTITINNAELGFTGALASTYIAWRVRHPATGNVWVITGSAFVGPDQFTFTIPNGHGIGPGAVVDIIPPIEPIPVDVTIQEVRLWETAPSAAVVAAMAKKRSFTDPLSTDQAENPLGAPGIGNSSAVGMIAYWPLGEDGGVVAAESIVGAHAYFAPSVVVQDRQSGNPSSEYCLVLDGETTGLHSRVAKDPNFARNMLYNLGRAAGTETHWNLCFRLSFRLGSNIIGSTAGNIQDHIYQVLASFGDPATGPLLEARVTNFGVGTPATVYFALPNGTYQTIAGVSLQPGVWYSAILGIEAFTPGSNSHYVYFQAWDASGNVTGGFAGPFTLANINAQVGIDYRVVAGASVRGQDTLGVQRCNHAMMAVGCFGYGFHPAHKAATSNPTDLIEWIELEPLSSPAEVIPTLQQGAAGSSFTKGSRSVTTVAGESLPSYARRWPIQASQVDLVYREREQADELIPDHLIIRSVSGSTLTLARAFEGESVSGVTLRVQVWMAYTAGKLIEPDFDTDLNAARESSTDLWALTDGVPKDLLDGIAGFSWGIDPSYEFVAPLRIAPTWNRGVVARLDIQIAAVKDFRSDRGPSALVLVAAGSMFEVDPRWRRGDPFDDEGVSWEFRTITEAERRRRDRDQGLKLFSRKTSVPRAEAVALPSGRAVLDSAETFASRAAYRFETWVYLDDTDGIRTIGAAAELQVVSDGSAIRYCWKKNWHWFLDNGAQAFEIVNETTGTRWRATLTRSNRIRRGRWTCLGVVLAGAAGSITGATFFIDGRPITPTVTGGPLAMTSVPSVAGVAHLGACGDPEKAFFHGLGGRMKGFRMDADASVAAYACARIEAVDSASMSEAPDIIVPMDDGAWPWFSTDVDTLKASFIGDELFHVGSGMGDSTGRQVAVEVFGDALYLTNGATRPWRYDFVELTPAGLRPPAGKLLSAAIARRPLRVRGLGADVPSAIGAANRTSLVVGLGPNLTLFAGATPFANLAEVGALVYIPTDPDQNNGGVNDTPGDYIGVVQGVTAAGLYTLNPSPYPEQAAAAADVAWSLFKRAITTFPTTALSYLDAIQRLESTSPYSPKRLMPDGKDDNDIPTTEDLTTVITAGNAFHFRGNQYVEFPPFTADGMPYAVDKVLTVKGYLRIDDFDVLGDDEQVVAEHALDAGAGSWRIVLFGGGRLRFEFFDTGLGAMRSIQTVGRVVSAKQWYYLALRYRFKEVGRCVFDTRGGWEPDHRWQYKSAAGTQLQKSRNYRDGIWVFACEGLHLRNENIVHAAPTVGYYGDVDDGVPCLLQTLPGCHGQVGAGAAAVARATPAAYNHSQHLPNLALLRDRPYLTPERGDAFFPATGASAAVDSGIALTLLTQTIQGIGAGIAAVNFQVPAGWAVPRGVSFNRDDAFDRNHTNLAQGTQIAQNAATTKWYNQATGPTAVVTATPNLANGVLVGDSYGSKECWAVLVRVWTIVATGGGAGVVGGAVDVVAGSGDAARVLALVHIGSNDLGNAARGGVSGHSIYLTDDVAYGGDGGGPLRYGGALLAVGAQVHATFELQNGSNQSRVSTNRLVTPTLVEHGFNPVGVGDSPDTSSAPVRFGGTVEQGTEGQIKSGLRGRMKHFGFAIYNLATSPTAIYTTDSPPPDAFFHGPADTRIASLPRLAFSYNAATMDDNGNAWSGTAATRATLVALLDDLSGDAVLKDAAASAPTAPNGRLVLDGGSVQEKGEHRFRVTYFDPRQRVESNPGPEFIVKLEGEDGAGDLLEAEGVFTLTGIPISADRRLGLIRRIYKTLADGGVSYLFAEIDDNQTTAVTPRADRRRHVTGKVLDVDNGQPPYCRALRATESHMVFAGLDDAPSVTAWSKAFKPEHVPGAPIGYAESGRGGPLIGIGQLRGNVVVAKRTAVFVQQHVGAAIQTSRIEQAIGALGHGSFADIDASLFFAAAKGVYIFAGNQTVWPTSEAIERLWRHALDLEEMERSQAAADLDRAQYVLTAVERGAEYPQLLLTCERRRNQFGDWNYVWSVLRPGIPVHALGEWQEQLQRTARIVIGTDGFVMLHDEPDAGVGVPFESRLTGGLIGRVAPGSSDGVLMVQGLPYTADNLRDGVGGVPVVVARELFENGDPATFDTDENFALVRDHIVTSAPVGTDRVNLATRSRRDWSEHVGQLVIIGGHSWLWRSAEFGLGTLLREKRLTSIQFHFNPIEGGVAFVDVDVDSKPWRTVRMPLDDGTLQIGIAAAVGRTMRITLRGYGFPQGISFHQLELKAEPHAYGGRQQE